MEEAGDIKLYVVTARRIFVEEIGAPCRVTLVEPAPLSRHLCPVPSHPHRVLHMYRQAPIPPSLALEFGAWADPAGAPLWMSEAAAASDPQQAAAAAPSAAAPVHGFPTVPGLAAVRILETSPLDALIDAPPPPPAALPATALPPAARLAAPPPGAFSSLAGDNDGFELLCRAIRMVDEQQTTASPTAAGAMRAAGGGGGAVAGAAAAGGTGMMS